MSDDSILLEKDYVVGSECSSLCFKLRGKSVWPDGLWLTLRVHVPNIWVLRALVIVIVVQVWGRYMIIGYLDP